MDVVLMLLCIAGLSFAVKQLEGPFDVFSKVRNLVARIPVLGPVVFGVFTCDFCLGLWTSLGLYLLTNMGSWSITEAVVWAFGGGMFNALFARVMDKLNISIK